MSHTSSTSSASRSNASTHASAARPPKRDELAKNGVVTPPPHRVSQGQPSASQSCKRQKVVKTLGSVGPGFENGIFLTVNGVQHRDTDVDLLMFSNLNVAIILLLQIFVDRAHICRFMTRTQ